MLELKSWTAISVLQKHYYLFRTLSTGTIENMANTSQIYSPVTATLKCQLLSKDATKPVFGISDKRDSNQFPQLHRLARKLEIRL